MSYFSPGKLALELSVACRSFDVAGSGPRLCSAHSSRARPSHFITVSSLPLQKWGRMTHCEWFVVLREVMCTAPKYNGHILVFSKLIPPPLHLLTTPGLTLTDTSNSMTLCAGLSDLPEGAQRSAELCVPLFMFSVFLPAISVLLSSPKEQLFSNSLTY